MSIPRAQLLRQFKPHLRSQSSTTGPAADSPPGAMLISPAVSLVSNCVPFHLPTPWLRCLPPSQTFCASCTKWDPSCESLLLRIPLTHSLSWFQPCPLRRSLQTSVCSPKGTRPLSLSLHGDPLTPSHDCLACYYPFVVDLDSPLVSVPRSTDTDPCTGHNDVRALPHSERLATPRG